MLFAGLYVGRDAVRGLVCDQKGETIAQSVHTLATPSAPDKLPEGWREQDPLFWWEGALAVLREVIAFLREKEILPEAIKALSVTYDEGIVIPWGDGGEPRGKAIMPEDIRALAETRLVKKAGESFFTKMDCSSQPSSSLPKILWVKQQMPKGSESAKKFLDLGGFITGKLTNNYSLLDSSGAFEFGFDFINKRWPRFISTELGLDQELFPEVIDSGVSLGSISAECARQTGLSRETSVVAGADKRTAFLISAGASSPGEWVSSLGDALSIKGFSKKTIKDREKRISCRSCLGEAWLLEGKSFAGLEALKERFKDKNRGNEPEDFLEKTPTHLIIYPLLKTGETFPFASPDAEGFLIGRPRNEQELYAAYLEGAALVEKWGYELLEELGAGVEQKIYVAGEGSVSEKALQLRANVLGKTLLKVKMPTPEKGAAILAAFGITYENIAEAVRAMVQVDLKVEPEPEKAKIYKAKYRKFRNACRAVGYK